MTASSVEWENNIDCQSYLLMLWQTRSYFVFFLKILWKEALICNGVMSVYLLNLHWNLIISSAGEIGVTGRHLQFYVFSLDIGMLTWQTVFLLSQVIQDSACFKNMCLLWKVHHLQAWCSMPSKFLQSMILSILSLAMLMFTLKSQLFSVLRAWAEWGL